MNAQEISLSKEFKTQTTKAVFSILVFLLAYASLFLMAIILTLLCVYGGYFLIVNHPRLITIGL